MVGIAPYLGHRGTLGAPLIFLYFGLGVTSRDLSMTLTVLNLGVSGGSAPKQLGLEWCNLGKL